MTKYHPDKDIPAFARDLKTLSPSKIAKRILEVRNVERNPEAVYNWLTRHPEIYEQLKSEIVEGTPTVEQATTEAMYEKEAFNEIASVKKWMQFLRSRKRGQRPLQENYIRDRVSKFRRYMRGYQKHPDRFQKRDYDEILDDLHAKNVDDNEWATVAKDFMQGNLIEGWQLISVGKPRGYQKFRYMDFPDETLRKMLSWIKEQNQEVYEIDTAMWYHGLRINAIIEARAERFNAEKGTILVTEKFAEDKLFRLHPDIVKIVSARLGDRKSGLIWSVSKKTTGAINRAAIEKFIGMDAIRALAPKMKPDEQLEMPNHFWRHMAAQKVLRLTGRNYDRAAAILKTTAQSLKESYGGIGEAEVTAWEDEYFKTLDPYRLGLR